MPKFSVVVGAHNKEPYLEECLDSLAAQTLDDWEAVVVDDAASDGTPSVADRFAAKDRRVRVVHRDRNEGVHLARRAGVAEASGAYTLFLDGDDSLEPETLSKLDEALSVDPVDSLHFGVVAKASGTVSAKVAQDFQRRYNAGEGTLDRDELLFQVFDEKGGHGRDWCMTDRVFATPVLKRAFEAMTAERLDRGTDCYEYLVICSKIGQEATRNDILGHVRDLAADDGPLTVDALVDEAGQCRRSYEAAIDYAGRSGDERLVRAADGAKAKFLETVAGDWASRIADDDLTRAAYRLADALGPNEVALNLLLLARDGIYRDRDDDRPLADDAKTCTAFDLGLEVSDTAHAPKDVQARLDAVLSQAAGPMAAIERREAERAEKELVERYESQDVRILVSAHREFARFDADSLQMIQVGCAVNGGRLPLMLHDDEGDNDSALNKMLCEMTAQYWAWKHVDAKYVGFCHYRRYFNFSDTVYKENPWGEIIDGAIDDGAQARYGLDDKTIAAALEGYDVVHAPIQDLRSMPGAFTTPAEQYAAAPKLHIDDLIMCGEVVKDLYPDYAQDVDDYLNGHFSCFCNMYVMRGELFREYAEWVFPVLDRCIRAIDFTRYSVEGVRTPGHLAERLFNIYLCHAKRTGAGWRTKELQVVHFEDPSAHPAPEPMPVETPLRSTIPVVFAANNDYVPMVSTSIVSVLENADPAYRYDVVVLTSDISAENRAEMDAMVARYPHGHLRFVDVADVVGRYDLSTSNAHISNETYYRFLIQDLLPFYSKVLYLDSDLVVTGDVAELYHTDVTESLLAAARDVDFLGNLNFPNGKRMAYAKDVLKMSDPYDYFQAGVLLLNTAEMRRFMTMGQWLEAASDASLIYNDQDVLNRCCEGRVTYLDNAWNVMTDCDGRVERVFSFAPAADFNAYCAARRHPLVIHYAGVEKPWNSVGCDQRASFWDYARLTPFYVDLVVMCAKSKKRVFFSNVVPEDSPVRRIVDPIMPPGSRRREYLKAAGKVVLKLKGGDND